MCRRDGRPPIMSTVLSRNYFFVVVTSLIGYVCSQARSAKMEVDVPTRVPSKLEEIPVILPKSWPTVNPNHIPEGISAEVKNNSKEVVKRLNGRTGYLLPNHKPNDFLNHDRRSYGLATKNYCEYEGRYVRKGAQKYIPELDKVVVCRSINPLWISVYVCKVLLNAPEKYKDMTARLTMNCIKLCETKPGANTKPPADFPTWQWRLNNASLRLKTETPSTLENRAYRRLKPLGSSDAPTRGRKKATTRLKTTLWDGEWNAEWNDLKVQPVTMRREEAALRAAGLWFTTDDPAERTSLDQAEELRGGKSAAATPEQTSGGARRMAYPKTTWPSTVDVDLQEASPFFVRPKTTKAVGIQLIESEADASVPADLKGYVKEKSSSEDGSANVDAMANVPTAEPWDEPDEPGDDDPDDDQYK